MRESSERFLIQSKAYAFPYHYLVDVSPDGTISVYRQMASALEYMTYMTWVRDEVLQIEPRNLLDVGCGDGRLCSLLGPLVEQYVGVDLTEQAIAFARAFNPGAEFIVGSVSDVLGTFDVVTCIEVLEHIPEQGLPDFVTSLSEKVSPHGVLLVSVPTIARPLNPKHYRHYTLELLREHLAFHFDIVSYVYLFQCGYQTDWLNRLLSNRWFISHHIGLRRWVWKVYRSRYFYAQPSNGGHLVARLRAKA